MTALQFVESSQLTLALLRKSWWLNLETRRIAALIHSWAESILRCRRRTVHGMAGGIGHIDKDLACIGVDLEAFGVRL
jgi:hypothetical protein